MPIGFDRKAIKDSKKSANQVERKLTSSDETFPSDATSSIPKTQAKKSSKITTPDDDDDFNVEAAPQKNKRIFQIAIIAAIAVVAIMALFAYSGRGGTEKPDITDADDDPGAVAGNSSDNSDEGPYIYDENGNPVYSAETNEIVNDNAIDPGTPDYNSSDKSHTTPVVYGADDYLKDINGVAIAANYNVVRRDYVFDYVSYVAKRGIIDDGMEIYWLEADYEGKKYRIQVPFFYFKDFNETGVCRVQIEVLNIEGGGKIISYMNVVGEPEPQ